MSFLQTLSRTFQPNGFAHLFTPGVAHSLIESSITEKLHSLVRKSFTRYVSAVLTSCKGLGSLLIEGIDGDYFNVVGLPLCRLGLMLREFGVVLP